MIQWAIEPEEIKKYLCDLWKLEYPGQICLPSFYSWEIKKTSLCHIVYGKPASKISKQKINNFIQLINSGVALQPLVCLNGELIDGYHRYNAYKKCNIFDDINIYLNK